MNDVTMDIYAPAGTKVRYAFPEAGWDHHKSMGELHLKADAVYTVASTEVHSWHTLVTLEEVPGIQFNSVLFEEVTMSKAEQYIQKAENCLELADDALRRAEYAAYERLLHKADIYSQLANACAQVERNALEAKHLVRSRIS